MKQPARSVCCAPSSIGALVHAAGSRSRRRSLRKSNGTSRPPASRPAPITPACSSGLHHRAQRRSRRPARRRAPAARRAAAGAPAGPPAPPARETWYAEPVKVFDNLYFLGQTEFSVWAITTSQGIILLDAIFDYSVEDEVVGGLKKLGLDPAQIKYVMVSHGHLDHAGGAKFLQERFGARLLMSAADYDLLDQDNPSWKPKRDMVVTDGQQLTLGDTTLTLLPHARPHRRHDLDDLPGARRRPAATWWRNGAARSSTSVRSARGCSRLRQFGGALPRHRRQGRRRRDPVEPHGLRRQQDEAAGGAGAPAGAAASRTSSAPTSCSAT